MQKDAIIHWKPMTSSAGASASTLELESREVISIQRPTHSLQIYNFIILLDLSFPCCLTGMNYHCLLYQLCIILILTVQNEAWTTHELPHESQKLPFYLFRLHYDLFFSQVQWIPIYSGGILLPVNAQSVDVFFKSSTRAFSMLAINACPESAGVSGFAQYWSFSSLQV